MFPTEPPAAALLPALDRRHVLKGGILAAGALSAPLSAQLATQRGFTHGVASGEPGADGVLLWTRFVAGQDTQLDWRVMEADANRRVVAEGRATASPTSDFCCKAQVTGLEPGKWYYYRFTAPDGTQSDEGRTRTLPVGPTSRFRMAVFSCSNMGFGWFNAYAHAAESNQFDCALHLGDYFYEYGPGTYDNPDFAMRQPDPPREIVALADYRMRYAQYRSDRDLQRLHQVYPMISGWDDHESANDSWKGGAQNHQPETEGPWSVRKAAAMRAYREWMPVSDAPWAAYEIGDLATLFRLETRLEARSEQFDYASILSGKVTPESASAALVAFRDGVYNDPAREMLGARQQAWLAEGLMRSARAGKPWQVLVQQARHRAAPCRKPPVRHGRAHAPLCRGGRNGLAQRIAAQSRRVGRLSRRARAGAARRARSGCQPRQPGGRYPQRLGLRSCAGRGASGRRIRRPVGHLAGA